MGKQRLIKNWKKIYEFKSERKSFIKHYSKNMHPFCSIFHQWTFQEKSRNTWYRSHSNWPTNQAQQCLKTTSNGTFSTNSTSTSSLTQCRVVCERTSRRLWNLEEISFRIVLQNEDPNQLGAGVEVLAARQNIQIHPQRQRIPQTQQYSKSYSAQTISVLRKNLAFSMDVSMPSADPNYKLNPNIYFNNSDLFSLLSRNIDILP